MTQKPRLTHADYMKLAIKEAQKAYELGEIPVGCVIVYKDEIIASGYNTRETQQNALLHAEVNAINSACKVLSSWRLSGCRLYVTLEPCMMCMGAILNSRIDTVVFGACDPKSGICGEMPLSMGLSASPKTEIIAGICEEECQAILRKFFLKIR